jgi:4-aminobutyrate aminotransferase-like enzyme
MQIDKPIGPDAIIDLKERYLIPCVYHFYKDPPQMVRGEGCWLFGSDGRRYLDCYAGVSVHALGHCHPELVEAICRQVATLQHTTTIYLTEAIVKLAEALADILPGDIRRSFFCASGSEANEGAALLATLHTGRSRLLALTGGLHGRTKLTMSLTGLDFWRTDPNPVPGVDHVPAPHCLSCPWSQTFGQCNYECVQAVADAIDAGEAPAAMFVEPVQGNGGVIPMPPGYLPRLANLLTGAGVLLVVDEVQTGLGRTGHWYAVDAEDVRPDIVTGGKALGGGTPVGYFATTDAIAASYVRPGASTFGGNPVTAVAGCTVLKILRRDGLIDRSAELGKHLLARLRELADRYDMIGDVRGRGLMVGAELQDDDAPALTDRILEGMKDAGFLIGKTGPGRNVLTFQPPLIISTAQLDSMIHALDTQMGSL